MGAKAQLKLPFIASAEASVTPTLSSQRSTSTSSERDDSPKNVAIALLRESKRPLIIDDFHYLSREQQGIIIRALKSLIFDGLPVVLLAILHRRYDAVRVEKEITGRIELIEIPTWKPNELQDIPKVGFGLLNIDAQVSIANSFADESLGSPHLVQDFCRHICDNHGIDQTCANTFQIPQQFNLGPLFKQVAQSTSKVVFDRLARGPRQRSDRKTRRFVDGTSGDIYAAVIRAIALTKPGLTTIEYEEIRTKLRDIWLLTFRMLSKFQMS
jgi:hypothetical protein